MDADTKPAIENIAAAVARIEQQMVTKTDLKAELESRFDPAFGKLDQILGELKTIRQEQLALTYRVDKIEATPTVAHELKAKH